MREQAVSFPDTEADRSSNEAIADFYFVYPPAMYIALPVC